MISQRLIPMLVSYLCWSLSGVSGSQDVLSVHHQSEQKRKKTLPIGNGRCGVCVDTQGEWSSPKSGGDR